jgi:hypothetical protein
MLYKKLYCALASVILLGIVSACATHAQIQAQSIRTNNQSAKQQLQACATEVYDSPEYEALRPHAPLDVENATIEQMTDNSFVTDTEIKAILAVHPRFNACRQAYLNQVAQTTPSLVPVLAGYVTANEGSLLDLIQRKITWGAYVRGAHDRLPEFQSKLMAEAQRIDAGLNQENQAELAQRQAAANAMTQYFQTQQMIDALNRPVITSCSQWGYSTNCVSQ